MNGRSLEKREEVRWKSGQRMGKKTRGKVKKGAEKRERETEKKERD